MNLENINFNINNLDDDLKPTTSSTFTTDNYNNFLSESKKNYLILIHILIILKLMKIVLIIFLVMLY